MKGYDRSRRLIAIVAIGSGLLKLFPVLVMFTSVISVETTGNKACMYFIAIAATLQIAGGFLLLFDKHLLGFILVLAGCGIRILSGLGEPPMLDLLLDSLLAVFATYYLFKRKTTGA